MKPRTYPDETLEEKKQRARKIIRELRNEYPDAKCSLRFSNPFELSVATILSAQCTDKRVNAVTADLFDQYPGPEDFVRADQSELEEAIRSTGLYRNKAKSIKGFASRLLEKYEGEVPENLEDLTTLPGVGRKTANVILGVAFEVPGIAVDTHVKRISRLLGLTTETDPEKIEYDLQEILPREEWIHWAHLIIDHGRQVCKARNPQCEDCVLLPFCPSGETKIA
mgnify:CR=1 FL=1